MMVERRGDLGNKRDGGEQTIHFHSREMERDKRRDDDDDDDDAANILYAEKREE
jgi:hypothetical protein